jgi:hypothetical protein
MKNIKRKLITASIISLLLTGCTTATNNNENININPKKDEKTISQKFEQPKNQEIVSTENNIDEYELDINNIPDELYDTIFKSEIILDLAVNYNSEEPRTLNEYNLNNDIAFNVMYGAENGWPFLSIEEIQPEESILIQEKSGYVYQNKFKASDVDNILKNIFTCSDDYLNLIKSERYSQTDVSPSDGYFYDNDYYYFCSMMAGYDVVLNSIDIKAVEKLDDNKYKINYEANYETNVLYDNYLYRPTKRESIVLKTDDGNWSILNSTFIDE